MNRQYAPQIFTPASDLFARSLRDLSYLTRRKAMTQRYGYPRHFYRYTTLDPSSDGSMGRLRQVLIESLLWLSAPQDFNDPFDMSAHLVFEGTGAEKRAALKAKFKLAAPEVPWKKREQRINELVTNQSEALRAIREGFGQAIRNAGVCCFTTNPRNLLMWSHYADNHKGLVLQFEPARDPDVFTRPTEVTYSTDYPVINWCGDTYEQLRSTMLRKYQAWEYEEEWRIVYPEGSRKLYPFSHAGLTGIVFGCRASSALKTAVSDLLTERASRGYSAVSLYQAEMHPTKYKLTVKKI